MAIRSLCAAIEARLFIYRKVAEQMAALGGVEFEAAEKEILSEERIVVRNGMQTKQPKWLPIPDSVKESFRLFAKATGATITIDCGVSGYSALRKTFEVRNRLMHPKSPFDVAVKVQDIETAGQAIDWFNSTHADTIDKCLAHIAQTVKAARNSTPGQTT